MSAVRKAKGRPDDADIRVGQAIRERRTRLGVSQVDLAGRIGVSFQQIQKYEKGVNRISAGRLAAVAKALDVPVEYFYGHVLPDGFVTMADRYILALDDGIGAVEAVAGYARMAATELPAVVRDLRTLRDDLERHRVVTGRSADFLVEG